VKPAASAAASAPASAQRPWGNVRIDPAFASPTVAFGPYQCTAAAGRAAAEQHPRWPVIVMPHGVPFVLCQGRHRTVVDPNSYLFFNGAEPYRASHPFGCGDHGSYLFLSPGTLVETLGEIDPSVQGRPDRPFAAMQAPSRPGAYLAERLLLRLARMTPTVDTLTLEELALDLARSAFSALFAATGGRSATGHPAHGRELSEAVKELLVERLREPMSLGAIASELGVSPSYLERTFRRDSGMPIYRYRKRLRLRGSLLAVLEADRELARIALDFGFSSHSHFTAAFRREFGISPRDLRRTGSTRSLRALLG
jgi:AraC family transcriptional regulator